MKILVFFLCLLSANVVGQEQTKQPPRLEIVAGYPFIYAGLRHHYNTHWASRFGLSWEKKSTNNDSFYESTESVMPRIGVQYAFTNKKIRPVLFSEILGILKYSNFYNVSYSSTTNNSLYREILGISLGVGVGGEALIKNRFSIAAYIEPMYGYNKYYETDAYRSTKTSTTYNKMEFNWEYRVTIGCRL